MNEARPRRSIRYKLLLATLGIWLLVTAVLLAAVAWAQYRGSFDLARRTEYRVRENQREKGRLLVGNQALLLRGLALDNAVTDVAELVRQTVQEDLDVIYGSFVSAKGAPWIVVTPRTRADGVDGDDARQWLLEYSPTEPEQHSEVPRIRLLRVFAANVEEHSADVFDGAEYLGTVRYGLSTTRTEVAVQQELERARSSSSQLLTLMALIGGLGVVLGAAAIGSIAHRITRPLSELARASEELGRGNRSVRVSVESRDEVELLATTFNAMAEANERAMAALEVKTAEALESSRLKSEFLANMSHEIRTPMNGILGVVRLVKKLPLEGKLRRYVETIDSSASALLTIINDVLDFSKIEAGKYEIRCVPFDVRTVVQEVCELLAPRAHDKGLELICRVDPAINALYQGDPDRIRQLVNNLVGNAIKFTERGEVFVDLRLQLRDGRSEVFRVTVSDTGVGIAEQDIPKLFDAFSQVDGSAVRRFGGTGLGLAISKRLVDMMGGMIGVSSALGRGSEFYFQLRLDTAGEITADRGTWAEGKSALVVDAQRRWQEVVGEHLRAWGMTVVCLTGREKALEYLRQDHLQKFHVAVVSCEQGEPSMSDFVRSVRAIDMCNFLPIVGVCQLGAGLQVAEVERELSAQLTKPLRFSELYNTLQQILLGGPKGHQPSHSSGKLPLERGGGRVLVVDDNEINRFVAAETLEQLGYVVDTAENGIDAVKLVQRTEYVAVLMDCQMPVMDGYMATREIRAWESKQDGRHQVIIALTAHALPGEREKVLSAGMDDYLAKPVRPSALERMIRRYAKSDRVPMPLQVRGKAPVRSWGFDSQGAVTPVQNNAAVQPATPADDHSPAEPAIEAPVLDPALPRSRKLIELFLKNVPLQLDSLDSAIEKGILSEVRVHAHKTKGSCLAMGAVRMAKQAERLQQLAEVGSLEGAKELEVALRNSFCSAAEELRAKLSALD